VVPLRLEELDLSERHKLGGVEASARGQEVLYAAALGVCG
jgi:hypothetical protein